MISRCRDDGDAAGMLSDVDGRCLAVCTNDKEKTNDPVLLQFFCHCRPSSIVDCPHAHIEVQLWMAATFERDLPDTAVAVHEVSSASIAITTECDSSSTTTNTTLRERKSMEVCIRLSNRLFVRQIRTRAWLSSNAHAIKLDAVLHVETAPPDCSSERRKKSACVVEWKCSVSVRVCERKGGGCRCVSDAYLELFQQNKQAKIWQQSANGRRRHKLLIK